MIISILHISDLHRDRAHPLSNAALSAPLARNQQHYTRENPAIKTSDLVLVSGDFVAGVKLTAPDASVPNSRVSVYRC
jgi:predicted MPP superfamily phosphohydrolase